MCMKKLLLILFYFLPVYGFSQDSLAIEKVTDSIFSHNEKTKRKRIKTGIDSLNYRIWYKRKTDDIVLIEEFHISKNDKTDRFKIYKYHFRDGKLVFLSMYNNRSVKDPLRKVCFYYFVNDALYYKHEYKASIPNLWNEQRKAYILKQKLKPGFQSQTDIL